MSEARHQVRTESALLKAARTPHTQTVWLKPPCRLEADERVTIQHNLSPSDVTNHFTGAPFTLLGAELWTCYGCEGRKVEVANLFNSLF